MGMSVTVFDKGCLFPLVPSESNRENHSCFSYPIGFFTYTQKYQCWHFRLYCVETTNSSDKMLPPVGIEPRPLILSPTLPFLH